MHSKHLQKIILIFIFLPFNVFADVGTGIKVQPIQSTIAEETFQTLIVSEALKALGYEVAKPKETDYNIAFAAVAKNDATFLAVQWYPLHKDKYENAGGDKTFYSKGDYIQGAAQGYLIDKKTADKYKITNIGQLKDPKLAKLFDSNGDGKADLTGCNPGWGCEAVIEHQLSTFGLGKSVVHNQGNYSAIISDTIARYKTGKPILYYTWVPYWVSGVLVPGKDVVWLEVPFSSLPDDRKDVDTKLPNGKNYGFEINSMRIVANKKWAKQNPAAAKLFSIMKLPIKDINAENNLMRKGETSSKDIQNHANSWIKANKKTFDSWIKQARAAK